MKRPLLLVAAFSPLSPLLANEATTISSPAPALSQAQKPASTITFLDRGLAQTTRRGAPALLISTPSSAEKIVVHVVVKPQTPPSTAKLNVPKSEAPKLNVPKLEAQLSANPVVETTPANARVAVLPKTRWPKSQPVFQSGAPSPEIREMPAPPKQVAITALKPLPKDKVEPVQLALAPRKAPARVAPSSVASRRAMQQRQMLAALDADLARAEKRLHSSNIKLTEGQRQLGSINNLLQAALLDTTEDARGLHPFVRVAQRYLGTPYVWGGESARGFDCSGFIMRVMRDLGYKALPHSAAEQFNYGTPVSKALLKPGDIVFFANTYKPGVSHVGIYLGRGRFIHAANSKQGTIVSGLNEPKWIQHYAGARRLVRVS